MVVLYKSGDLTDLQDTLTSSHFKEFDYQGETLPKERLEQLKREIKEQGAVEAATLETLSQAKEDLQPAQVPTRLCLESRSPRRGQRLSCQYSPFGCPRGMD